ncbi:MAG: type II secretion system F family protein [Actinomycetaceae bacterium]|nr:type II secretion system F family protein [Actinomycetaceae bacterium]
MSIVSAIVLAAGLLLVVDAWTRRHNLLLERIRPYLDSAQSPHQHLRVAHRVTRFFTPVWERLGSTTASVQSRLEHLGTSTVQRFRQEQLLAGIGGMVAAIAGAAAIANLRPVAVIHWLVLTVVGFFAGTLAWDRYLTYQARVTTNRISRQVANTAELLALSISAGEPIPVALRRIEAIAGRELGRHLQAVLETIESGVPASRALTDLSTRTHSAQLARLIDTLVSAMERGTPLSAVLREQARDLRDEARRNLIESGGRKEIAMLFPVVFIILPITVIFALYPGLVALRF